MRIRPATLTVVVTSAGRLEYLKVTLESLRDCLDTSQFVDVRWAIIDDDPEGTATREWIVESGHFDVVLLPPRNLGFGHALNSIFLEASTEFLFHSEDDWQYLRSLRLHEFAELLTESPFKPEQVLAYREPIAPIDREYQGAVEVKPGLGLLHQYSFNPSLFLLQSYLDHGPIPVFRREEEDYLEKLQRLGSDRAIVFDYLRSPLVRHIGYDSKLVIGRNWPERSADWISQQYRRSVDTDNDKA